LGKNNFHVDFPRVIARKVVVLRIDDFRVSENGMVCLERDVPLSEQSAEKVNKTKLGCYLGVDLLIVNLFLPIKASLLPSHLLECDR
jgi:hypothetical protein